MKYTLVILFYLFLSGFYAQNLSDTPYVEISGLIKDNEENRISNASIIITEGADTITSVSSSSSGKYRELKFDMGKVVTLHFIKEGYISKKIFIDSKTNFSKDDAVLVNSFDMQVILDKTQPNKDYSKLENDFFSGKLIIDPKIALLTNDFQYTAEQKKIYNETLKKLHKE